MLALAVMPLSAVRLIELRISPDAVVTTNRLALVGKSLELLVTYPHWERLSKLTLARSCAGRGTQDHFRMADDPEVSPLAPEWQVREWFASRKKTEQS